MMTISMAISMMVMTLSIGTSAMSVSAAIVAVGIIGIGLMIGAAGLILISRTVPAWIAIGGGVILLVIKNIAGMGTSVVQATIVVIAAI